MSTNPPVPENSFQGSEQSWQQGPYRTGPQLPGHSEPQYPPPPYPAAPAPPPPPYPAAPAPPLLRRVRGLSVAVTVLLAVLIAVDLGSLALGLRISGMLGTLDSDPDRYSDGEWESADALYAVSGVLQFTLVVAIAVCFIVWLHRARRNAEVFAPHGHGLSSGWAIGAWFVPLANLWLPCRVAIDTWRASAATDPVTLRPARRSTALVHAWWWLWVLSTVLGRGAGSAYQRAEQTDQLRESLTLLTVSDAVDIVAAVLAILFVRGLTRMQDTKVQSGIPVPLGG